MGNFEILKRDNSYGNAIHAFCNLSDELVLTLMPRRKRLFRKSYRSSSSSALVGYIVLFILAISLIQMLLPFIILAGVGWGIYKFWQYWNHQQQQTNNTYKEQQDKLISVLYKLIQKHQGRISVLDFAMSAKVSSTEAKIFLDEKAKEFLAEFEPTDSGDVLYVFNTLKNEEPSGPIPEVSYKKEIKSEIQTYNDACQIDKSVSLNQAALARRLNLSSSSIGRKKFSPDFAQWAQERDPEGWAWSYDVYRKCFHPVR